MKRRRTSRKFLFAVTLFLTLRSAGCHHKDVKTDSADDIVANLTYAGPEGTLIQGKEEIF